MPQSHYLTALNLYRNGQLTQAELAFQQVLTLQAKHADALHMLGIIYHQTNRAAEAAQHIQQALVIEPRNIDYLNNYGLVLRANHQPEAALKSFQQAILIQPKDLDIQLNIANTLLELNRFEEAASYYRRVLPVFSKRADANKSNISAALCHCLTSLGNQAHAAGNYVQAELCFQEALLFSSKTNTQDAALYYNLGNAQRELGKPIEAAKQYQTAVQLTPDDADIHNNLGNVQRELGQLDLAIESYKKALTINPRLYHARVHLVHQKQHSCDWQGLQEDISEIRNWVKTVPEAQISPFAFLAMPTTTAEEQKICANNWVSNRYATLIAHGKQLDFSYAVPRKSRKIKIGYLSADFRLHPLAFLVSELIELHDRSQFEIMAFSYGVNDKSSARTRLEKAFDQFHDVRNLSEIDAAKKIHACNIDILVDLTGFTQTSRSGIAALRPAPININWLGFPGTMGDLNPNNPLEPNQFLPPSRGKVRMGVEQWKGSASTPSLTLPLKGGGNIVANGQVKLNGGQPLFDYILSDKFISPPETAQHYAEQLALLPHCYQANDRKRPVGKTPLRQDCKLPDGNFVFCCFNQTFKITPDVFAVWMRLLKTVPNSVLWLLECNSWAKQNLIREAAAQGIVAEKLIFAPRVAIADHLARHVHADLFLDTLPYNAHTTCSDALWMGVPVLTCVGDTFAARVAGGLLNTLDLTELITYSLQAYENKAFYYASNPTILATVKQKLLANNATSPLFDTTLFARSLENLYQSIWQHHLETLEANDKAIKSN